MRLEDNKKPEWYCESSELSLDDQEWIWKNVPLPEEYAVADEIKLRELETNVNVSVSGSVNDTRKNGVAEKLHLSKQEVVVVLRRCNYRTPPKQIASLLEQLFSSYESKSGHWLYIAQHWTPRAINRVIARIIKLHKTGEVTVKNPAAYFTYLIKFRKKRSSLADSNDIRKRHDL